MEHPAVFECAVVARRDTDGLDKVRAVVVLNPVFRSTLARNLKRIFVRNFHAIKHRSGLVSQTTAKDTTGEIQRFALRQIS